MVQYHYDITMKAYVKCPWTGSPDTQGGHGSTYWRFPRSGPDAGVIRGAGVELVLTPGTGMGSALFVDGRLIPNLELGHHPWRKSQTYEEQIGNDELKRIGKRRWRKRVLKVFEQLEPIFNYDLLHVGGGNTKRLKVPLPDRVRIFDNVDGLAGGVRLRQHD